MSLKKIKKALTMVLTASVALSAAGCGKDVAKNNMTEEKTVETTVQESSSETISDDTKTTETAQYAMERSETESTKESESIQDITETYEDMSEYAIVEPETEGDLTSKQKNAVNMLNYIMTITQEINNSKESRLYLESAYSSLINNSDPGLIDTRTQAHQLVGEDIKENLITGTRYLNEAMIPTENEVADYVQKTGNHVLYRVTPVYKGENLLASGIQIEAYSVEDKGKGISENRYFYNVQPGIEINYNSGENSCADTTFQKEKILKFVTVDSGEKDLVHEMNKQLDILFKDQKKSEKTNDYNRMMSAIDENIRKVRNVGNKGETAGKQYILRREYEYEYYKILRKYLPSLLEQEQFFSNVFRD